MTGFEGLYAAPPALMAHAPVLMAAGPIIGAAACVLSGKSNWAWMISVLAAIFSVWMALCVAGEVARHGVVNYAIGGFAPPLGIAFRIDALGSLMSLLISSMGALAALFSGHGLRYEMREEKHALFQAGFLLCLAGLLGLVSTGDAFNAFVFLEVSSIGTYALVAIGANRDRRALPAAFNYLVMGTIGATFFVIGIGFLYSATGTLNMADIAARLATLTDLRTVQVGFAFIVVGLAIKAAVFPLHGWLPAAYAYAPALVSVFLAATATKAAIYLLARFIFTVFDPATVFTAHFLGWILMPLAGAAAIVCSLQAAFETDLRKALAFSSVAQVGYILMGLGLGTATGMSAGFLHLIAHSLMKAALFMALGGVAMTLRARTIAEFGGAGRDAPWTMGAFAIASASLMGLPFTIGFLSKWRLLEAALQAQQFWIVAVIAASSLMALVYVGRMVEALFFRATLPGAARAVEAPFGVIVPLWFLAGFSVWFGIDASLPESLANQAAAALLAPLQLGGVR